MTNKTEYAMYKGDEFIDIGTAEELAKKYNMKVTSVYYMAKKVYKEMVKEKGKGNRIEFIKIENDEENE